MFLDLFLTILSILCCWGILKTELTVEEAPMWFKILASLFVIIVRSLAIALIATQAYKIWI